MQQRFNPIDYGFEWTSDNWYEWDRKAAHAQARKDRDEAARKAKKAGKAVRKFRDEDQLISKGGIGSGRPHIEQVVTIYGINVEG